MSTTEIRQVTAGTHRAVISPELLNKANVDLEDALWLCRQPRTRVHKTMKSFRGSIILHRLQAYLVKPHATNGQPVTA